MGKGNRIKGVGGGLNLYNRALRNRMGSHFAVSAKILIISEV